MLEAIRKRQRSLLTIFIGLISVVFVFWGFYGGFSPSSSQEIASVNGESLSIQAFQSQYQQTVSIYQNILKDKFTPETAERFNLKQLTLNQLIDQKLILQGAKALGLGVTDQEIRDQVVEAPYFQKNGKFDAELYKNILKANRLTPASFEENIRLDLLQRKITGLLRDAIKVSEFETQKDYILENEKLNIEFVRVRPGGFKTQLTPSDEEIKTYFSSADHLKAAQQYFETNQHVYKLYHQVKARHILIKVDDKAAAEDKEKAKRKIQDLKERAKSEDFAKLAEENSQDTVSAKQGGDLGFFGRGRMVKAFEDQAFQLKPGEISDIVETPYGYHILKVEEIQEERQKTFEEVKENVFRTVYLNDKSQHLAQEITADLWKNRDNKSEFQKLLKDHQLAWEETGDFSLGTKFIPKIGEADELKIAAFKLHKAGELASKTFEVKDRFFLIRLKKHESVDLKKFEKEKEALVQKSLNQKQSNAYYEWLKNIKDSAKIKIRKDLLEGNRDAS